MDVTTTNYNRCSVIKTSGRIDGSNAPEFGKVLKELTESGIFNLVFDMSEVTFMASAGWWILIDTQKTCKKTNRGELVLVKVDKAIKDSLNLVGMSSYFKTFEDMTAAVGSF